MMLLKAEKLNKTFHNNGEDFLALNDVSFFIRRDECLGVIGESGSGKSTLARILALLTKADSGSVLLEGKEILSLKKREIPSVYRKIQMIFQSPQESFDPTKRLSYSILESLKNHGFSKDEAKERMEEMMELTDLSEKTLRHFPHEVSGGQCQRAAIARAAALSPELLICDEATSALDVTVQKQILELFRKLRDEKKTSFLFICHDPALVNEFCSRVLVMQNGRIVEEGSTEKILHHPEDPYTQSLLNSVL